MLYTLILANKRPVNGTIEFWDKLDHRKFKHPKTLANYLRGEGLFYPGLPYGDQIKVELHLGIDVTSKPMLIKSIIPRGKRTYRPCVHFPNGNIQELTDFLRHWKTQLQATEP